MAASESDGKGGERSHIPHLFGRRMDLTIPKCYTSTGSQIADYNYRFCDDYLERKFADVFCIRIQISNIAVDSLTKLRLGCPDEKQHVSEGSKSKSDRRKTSIYIK